MRIFIVERGRGVGKTFKKLKILTFEIKKIKNDIDFNTIILYTL